MNATDVKALLEEKIENCQVYADGEGCNFQVVVVSPVFAALNTVKRQQLVYSHLQEAIASGVIHAVTMKTYTPEQFAAL